MDMARLDAFLTFRATGEIRAILEALETRGSRAEQLWEQARPESRGGVLLWQAWEARSWNELPGVPETEAGRIAQQLHAFACEVGANPLWVQERWFGAHFPLWPLPDPHGMLLMPLLAGGRERATSWEVARALTF